MNLAEVVPSEVQGDGCFMVVQLLAESICQAGKATNWINNGSLDGDLLRGYWEPVIIKTFERYEYERYEYWIRQHRIRKEAPGYFDELEKLTKKWKSPKS